MPEELIGGIIKQASKIIDHAGRVAKAAEWRLSPEAVQAREELFAIRDEMSKLDSNNLPKILQLNVGGREYTSIRRIEGRALLSQDNGGSTESGLAFEIDPNLIPDSGIGILVTPHTVEAVDEQLYDEFGSYGGWEFGMAMYDGVEYREQDWEIGMLPVVYIKKTGGTLYEIPYQGRSSLETDDVFDKQHLINKLEPPNANGKTIIHQENDHLSQKETAIRQKWHQQQARFYVLLEGSSGTSKVRADLSRANNAVPEGQSL